MLVFEEVVRGKAEIINKLYDRVELIELVLQWGTR